MTLRAKDGNSYAADLVGQLERSVLKYHGV